MNSFVAEAPPLSLDRHSGAIRVGASRVTLELIVWAHRQGCSPDEIRERYPDVLEADVFSVIAYYLRHEADLEPYLARRQAVYDAATAALRARSSSAGT